MLRLGCAAGALAQVCSVLPLAFGHLQALARTMADPAAEAAGPAMSTLDAEAFELLADTCGQQWIFNSVQGKSVVLGKHEEGQWEMGLSEEGAPFVYIGGTDHELWIPDEFVVVPYKSRGITKVRTPCSGPALLSMQAFASRRKAITAGFRYPGALEVHEFRVWMFDKVMRGQAFWWEAKHLIELVLRPFRIKQNSKLETVATILSKRLPAWNNLAKELGLPPVRRQAPRPATVAVSRRRGPALPEDGNHFHRALGGNTRKPCFQTSVQRGVRFARSRCGFQAGA